MAFIRDTIKKILLNFLDTHKGRRMISMYLSHKHRYIVQKSDDHLVAYKPYDLIGEEIFEKGQFRRERANELVRFLVEKQYLGGSREPGVLVEIGGNIGTQSIYLMKTNAFRKIIVLEPNRECFDLLTWNILLNNLSESSMLFQSAAGERNKQAILSLRNFNLGASSLTTRLGRIDEAGYEVDVKRIDELLAENNIDPEDLGLFWIDAEGYELQIFKGMGTLIGKTAPVYFEYTPFVYESEERKDFAEIVFANFEEVYVHRSGFEQIDRKAFHELKGQVDILAL